MIVTRDSIESAIRDTDAPHVNLGPVLGLNGELRVGLEDMHALLASGEPSFRLEWNNAVVTVRRQDGGVMATLEVRW